MSPDPIIDLTKSTVALFIIVDPIGLVPVFSNMTRTMSVADRAKMFRVVIYTGAQASDRFCLRRTRTACIVWNHSPSFQIAGGLLLLLLSLDILLRGQRPARPVSHEDIGVVPSPSHCSWDPEQ